MSLEKAAESAPRLEPWTKVNLDMAMAREIPVCVSLQIDENLSAWLHGFDGIDDGAHSTENIWSTIRRAVEIGWISSEAPDAVKKAFGLFMARELAPCVHRTDKPGVSWSMALLTEDDEHPDLAEMGRQDIFEALCALPSAWGPWTEKGQAPQNVSWSAVFPEAKLPQERSSVVDHMLWDIALEVEKDMARVLGSACPKGLKAKAFHTGGSQHHSIVGPLTLDWNREGGWNRMMREMAALVEKSRLDIEAEPSSGRKKSLRV